MHCQFNGSGGIKLAADAFGDPSGPSVLLLPGFGQTREAWIHAAKALATAGRYVVTLDLRGHGGSDWAPNRQYSLDDVVGDVIAVLEQMPSRPAVVGVSLGGLAALAAIGESEEPLASAIVLIEAAPRMVPTGLDKLSALMTSDKSGFATVEEAAAALSQHLPGRRPDIEELKGHLRRSDDGLFRWHVDPAYQGAQSDDELRLEAQNRFKAAARKIQIPTLLMRGEVSGVVDKKSVDIFRDLVPHTEVAEVPGVGDVVVGDRNDAFDAAILGFLERVVPRPGAEESRGGVEPRLLRDALGCFATGVTVITTCDAKGEPLGFTANSFTSVSLTPPLVLFCVKRDSASMAALRSQGAFAVNILHIGQQNVSTVFASKTEDRFSQVAWEKWEMGVPIIQDSMANIECNIHEILEGGDHFVVVGRVLRVNFDPARDPLLFLQGKYRRIHVSR